MPINSSHPTEFRLREIIDIQNSIDNTINESQSQSSKSTVRSESEKHINALLLWAY